MRRSLKVYVALVAGSAAIVLMHDLADVPSAPHPWSWVLVLALAVLSTAAQHMQFQVARGWFSTAGAVAAISSAMLLPPGLAELVMVIGAASRVLRVRQAPSRAIFNVGSATLSIAAAAHLANFFGGPELLDRSKRLRRACRSPRQWPSVLLVSARPSPEPSRSTRISHCGTSCAARLVSKPWPRSAWAWSARRSRSS